LYRAPARSNNSGTKRNPPGTPASRTRPAGSQAGVDGPRKTAASVATKLPGQVALKPLPDPPLRQCPAVLTFDPTK